MALDYTCAEPDLGAKLRVEAAGSAVEGLLARTCDPAPVPSPDRVPRTEVYEKAWAELGWVL